MANPQQPFQIPLPTANTTHFQRALEQRLAEFQRGVLSLLFISKNGSPYDVIDAPRGSLCLRLDGGANTTLYVNETGGKTGWVAK